MLGYKSTCKKVIFITRSEYKALLQWEDDGAICPEDIEYIIVEEEKTEE